MYCNTNLLHTTLKLKSSLYFRAKNLPVYFLAQIDCRMYEAALLVCSE